MIFIDILFYQLTISRNGKQGMLDKIYHIFIFFLFATALSCTNTIPVHSYTSITTMSHPLTQKTEVITDYLKIQETMPGNIYLPLVSNGNAKFIGIIMKKYWSKENVAQFMSEADALAGKQHTAVGWFINIQDPAFYEEWETESALNRNNFYRQLEQLWQKGYLSLVKIGSTDTAKSIFEGKYDNHLAQMANIYKVWVKQGGGRKAMLAPLQEMNGDWVAYYTSGTKLYQKQQDFKKAFRHIQDIFNKNGVERSSVWWVFAPNGLSSPDVPENGFEYYYPGDDQVDLIGFASYNYGFCPATLSSKCEGGDCGRWENYDTIYEPYIRRMHELAPSKPILVTETGSSAMYTRQDREKNQYNYPKKAEWLILNYGYLAERPMVLGIFYFDVDDFDGTFCDLSLPSGIGFDGYQQAVNKYQYLTTSQLDKFIP